MKFTQVSEAVFKEIQLGAGMVLKTLDPTGAKAVTDEDVICATTGGIEAACKPTYTDYGEDIDNCPDGTVELMKLDRWDPTMAFTALNASAEFIRLALGAADIGDDGKITPRMEMDPSKDVKDIWWAGDRADGGTVAVCLKKALSTEGFTLKTTKKGKGQLSCTLKGHVSINAQNVVPMEFYVQEGAPEAAKANEQEVTEK